MGEDRNNRIQELDALRGIAALSVVFFHFTQGRPQAELGFRFGIAGVDLFFMISGFVIFMSLTGCQSGLRFAIGRFSRLYPTYWTAVTFTYVSMVILAAFGAKPHGSILLSDYLANVTMFQFYLDVKDLDGPYWTLIVEMVFYLMVLTGMKLGTIKHIGMVGLLLTIGSGLLVLFNDRLAMVEPIANWFPLLPFVPLFYAGIVFYQLWADKMTYWRKYLLLIVCLVVQILLFPFGRAQGFMTQLEYGLLLTGFFIGFTLIAHDRLKFPVSKVTVFLGSISYAVYLIHNHIGKRVLISFLVDDLNINFWFSSLLVVTPLVILLGWGLTKFIDVPGRRFFKRWLTDLLIAD